MYERKCQHARRGGPEAEMSEPGPGSVVVWLWWRRLVLSVVVPLLLAERWGHHSTATCRGKVGSAVSWKVTVVVGGRGRGPVGGDTLLLAFVCREGNILLTESLWFWGITYVYALNSNPMYPCFVYDSIQCAWQFMALPSQVLAQSWWLGNARYYTAVYWGWG